MSKTDIQPNETKPTIKIRGVYPQTNEHLYKVYAAPIKFKKLHPDAVTPTHAYFGDAGFDLTAVGKKIDRTNRCIIYNIGIAVEIPLGYAMFIFPRSSAYKHDALMTNCVGVIDSGYRGDIHVIFKGLDVRYNVGDRIAQAVILKVDPFYFEETKELSSSSRGKNGLGSSGVKNN